MAAGNGSNNPDRLDRVEGIIEALADRHHLIEDEFARLLRAQVVMGDALTKVVEAQAKLAEAQARMADAQAHADRRMDALSLLSMTLSDGACLNRSR